MAQSEQGTESCVGSQLKKCYGMTDSIHSHPLTVKSQNLILPAVPGKRNKFSRIPSEHKEFVMIPYALSSSTIFWHCSTLFTISIFRLAKGFPRLHRLFHFLIKSFRYLATMYTNPIPREAAKVSLINDLFSMLIFSLNCANFCPDSFFTISHFMQQT